MCANRALLGVDVRDRAARDVGDGERRCWADRRIGSDRGDSLLRSRHSGGSLLDGVRPASARTVEQLDGFRVLLRPPRAAAARAVTCWASSGTADRGVADAAGARKPSSSSGFRARCAPSTYRRNGGRAGRPSVLTRCSAEAGHRGEALGPVGRPRRSVESWWPGQGPGSSGDRQPGARRGCPGAEAPYGTAIGGGSSGKRHGNPLNGPVRRLGWFGVREFEYPANFLAPSRFPFCQRGVEQNRVIVEAAAAAARPPLSGRPTGPTGRAAALAFGFGSSGLVPDGRWPQLVGSLPCPSLPGRATVGGRRPNPVRGRCGAGGGSGPCAGAVQPAKTRVPGEMTPAVHQSATDPEERRAGHLRAGLLRGNCRAHAAVCARDGGRGGLPRTRARIGAGLVRSRGGPGPVCYPSTAYRAVSERK